MPSTRSGITTHLVISLTMILTYFCRKVKFFKIYPQVMHNAEWRITNKSERSEPLLPEIVAHGVGFCQKKWLLHYDRNGNLPYCEPRTIPTSMLWRRLCILAAQVHFPTYRSGWRSHSGRLWCTTMVSVWAKRCIV